jgi:hypothetical protein
MASVPEVDRTPEVEEPEKSPPHPDDHEPVRIDVRRHAAGFSVEAHREGRSIGTLEAELRTHDTARATRFTVDAGAAQTVAADMLEAARAQVQDLGFRWRKEGTGSSEPGQVELLRESETADEFWRARGESGASSYFNAEDARARKVIAEQAAAEISAFTGEPAPDLRGRVRFLAPAEFEAELVERGCPPENGERTLGVYFPRSREILVRDSLEARRQAVLVHEGLHAWREERAEQAIPRPLNEALTQHFTEVIDPSAGRTVGVERLDGGRIRLLVPGSEQTATSGRVEVTPAPTVYAEGVRVVHMLEARVGRDVLLEYYRTGDPALVRGRLAEQLGRAAWPRFADAAASESWAGAEAVLR